MIFQFIPQVYAAEAWSDPCVDDGVATIRGIECVFERLVSPVPALLALVAVGMIIMAGVRLLNAGSDPKAVASAWSTFTWAVIGLILLAVVWIILILIGKFTGANVTTFTIPT
ncbi:MAG TPA: hypothetical protein VLH94_01115 [Spirochaetia bacterium]|nr:hypothetical protein [Spirochaetia bacterium]